MVPRGVEFFPKSDREDNKRKCSEEAKKKNFAKLNFTNIKVLVGACTDIHRGHIKIRVRVKRIKQFRLRL